MINLTLRMKYFKLHKQNIRYIKLLITNYIKKRIVIMNEITI